MPASHCFSLQRDIDLSCHMFHMFFLFVCLFVCFKKTVYTVYCTYYFTQDPTLSYYFRVVYSQTLLVVPTIIKSRMYQGEDTCDKDSTCVECLCHKLQLDIWAGVKVMQCLFAIYYVLKIIELTKEKCGGGGPGGWGKSKKLIVPTASLKVKSTNAQTKRPIYTRGQSKPFKC